MSEHNLVAPSMIPLPRTKYREEDCKLWGPVNNHSKFGYLKTVKEILSDSLFSRLETTFLGPIIKAGLRKAGGNQKGVEGLGFSGQLVHFLLVRQLVSSREDEIWFCINNKPMRFSLTEFHLVTGLPCWIKDDEVPVDFECDWPLLLNKAHIKVDDLIAQLKVLDDEESKLRLAMLIVILTIFMMPYGITKYSVSKNCFDNAKKNIYAYSWGEASFKMLVSSVKDIDKKKNLAYIDLKGFPMALQLWLLGSVSELEEAYARPDDESDRFPICARYLSTVQPSYEQIMSKEKDLEVLSVLGDSNEEEDDVLMHLLKSDYIFSELDWKRGYALVPHQEDEEVEIGDGSDADVGETQTDADAETQTADITGETQTDAGAETRTEDSADETQTLEKDQGLDEGFQQLSFQDDEPSASTAVTISSPKKSRFGRVFKPKKRFSPS